jgi:hypothetical protein
MGFDGKEEHFCPQWKNIQLLFKIQDVYAPFQKSLDEYQIFNSKHRKIILLTLKRRDFANYLRKMKMAILFTIALIVGTPTIPNVLLNKVISNPNILLSNRKFWKCSKEIFLQMKAWSL